MAIMIAALVAGCSTQSADGEQSYTTYCAACHGATGEGTPAGPSLLLSLAEDGEIGDIIRNGVDQSDDFPAMAPVGGLSEEQISAIVTHVRVLQAGG
jgi:mono/diheme cytochrome c family protein